MGEGINLKAGGRKGQISWWGKQEEILILFLETILWKIQIISVTAVIISKYIKDRLFCYSMISCRVLLLLLFVFDCFLTLAGLELSM